MTGGEPRATTALAPGTALLRRHRPTVGGRLVTILALAVIAAGSGWLQPAAARAAGCTDTWTGPAGATDLSGEWEVAANWSSGAVPTSADDVCLTAPGAYTVTVTTGAVAHALTLGDGGNAPVLALDTRYSAALGLGANSTIAPGATLQVLGAPTLSSVSLTIAPGTILTNAGTLEVAPSGKTEFVGALDNQGSIVVSGRRDPFLGVAQLTLTGPLANLDGGTLRGGIWDLSGCLHLPTGTEVTVNAATVSESRGSNACGYAASDRIQPALNLGTLTLVGGLWRWDSQMENRGTVNVVNAAILAIDGGYTQNAAAAGPPPVTTISGSSSGGLDPSLSQIDTGSNALVLNAGTLTGGGYVHADGNLINVAGVVRPEPTLHLNLGGGYIQGAAGTLDITLTDPTHSTSLDTGPTISLDGTLRITTAPGVTPTPGSAVPIITSWAPYPTGRFATVTTGSPSANRSWQVATAPFQAAAPAVPGVTIRSMLVPTLTETLSSGSVAYGSALRVTGRLSVGGTADANARVTLYRRAPGSPTWTAVAAGSTSSTGTVAFTVFPKASGAYRLGVAADATHVTATSGSLPVAVHALRLAAGQHVASPDGRYLLVMQNDGNLVEYGPGNRAVWSSRTNGHTGAFLVMQSDGNAVIYAGGRALWTSRTAGHPGAQMVVQNDGNVVVYSTAGRALWASGVR